MRVIEALIAAWHRLTALFTRRRLRQDIDAEVAFHLAMREAEYASAEPPQTKSFPGASSRILAPRRSW